MDRKSLVALVAAATVATAGCGGSSALSRTDLVRHVNAICGQREARIQAVLASSREYRAAERRLLPAMDKDVRALDALKPPSSLQARYERFVADERLRVTRMSRTLAGKPVSDAPDAEHGHERYGLIRALGFTDCH
jgi:hypothetical protein